MRSSRAVIGCLLLQCFLWLGSSFVLEKLHKGFDHVRKQIHVVSNSILPHEHHHHHNCHHDPNDLYYQQSYNNFHENKLHDEIYDVTAVPLTTEAVNTNAGGTVKLYNNKIP